jgi:hypothetical protein
VANQAPVTSTAEIFGRLREVLVEVMGTAATATFLRRAVRRARARYPELAALEITKRDLEYEYALPPRWSAGTAALPELVGLSSELSQLLVAMTGSIMLRRLRAERDLASAGLFQERGDD